MTWTCLHQTRDATLLHLPFLEAQALDLLDDAAPTLRQARVCDFAAMTLKHRKSCRALSYRYASPMAASARSVDINQAYGSAGDALRSAAPVGLEG